MGTRWRGLLAPIDESTGDGRRLKQGGGSWRELPFGLKWQRVDAGGHDDSVIVASTDTMNIGTVEQAIKNNWISAEAVGKTMQMSTLGVWAGGEIFDDPDIAKALPRLTEDVEEAKLLLSRGVIGPSIDPDNVTSAVVRKGSDIPLTWDEIDMILWECEANRIDPATVLETLYMTWRVCASTLVGIPAFEECRPFELGPFADAPADGSTVDGALVASLTAAAAAEKTVIYPADAFTQTPSDVVHALAVTDNGDGWLRIAGYAAQAGTCHAEFRDVCVAPPQTMTDFALFHRHPVDTTAGLLPTGRITTGYGNVGTGCTCCPGKDDHACGRFDLPQTLAHYDQLRTVAHVRATSTPLGDWVCGVVDPTATPAELAILSRRMFSGDWRGWGGNLELVELLALATEKPGFLVPTMATTRGGRALSLTAAGGVAPEPRRPAATMPAGTQLSEQRIADLVVAQLTSRGVIPPAAEPEPITAAAAHTGAMVALRMSETDASRMALTDGEAMEELHTTLVYLGEAADIPADRQAGIIAALQELASSVGPMECRAGSVCVFNPDASAGDDMPAIVLGVGGGDLAALHARVTEVIGQQFACPEQFSPWSPHITLAYSTDFDLVGEVADRVGPMTFDRIRVAFGGVVTDIQLIGGTAIASADGLAAEVDEAFASVDAADRARTAEQLAREIEGVTV